MTIPAKYILRLDDIAPNMNWRGFTEIQIACEETGIKPLLGVIPDNRDPQLLKFPRAPFPFFHEMRRLQEADWTIAQHGFQHLCTSRSGGLLGLANKSEFAGLPFALQRKKIEAGRSILAANGLPTDIFMAPSHSFDESTLSGLVDLGFTQVTDGLSLLPYRDRGLLFIPQLFGAPKPMPFGLFTFCLHLNTMSVSEIFRVAGFLRRHAKHFVPFTDAERFESSNRLHRRIGAAIDGALRLRARARQRHISKPVGRSGRRSNPEAASI